MFVLIHRVLRSSFVLAVSITAATLLALDHRRPLSTYPVEVWKEGLPQQMVQSVVQTRDGALWLGTFEGLVRFNGVDFTVFDRRTHPEITEWRVKSLVEGADGSLWAGTIGGGVLRYRKGAFRRFTKEDGLPGNTVLALKQTADGTLWAGGGDGLARLVGERFEAVASLRPSVEAMAIDRGGELLVGASDGLYRLTNGELQRIPLRQGERQPYVLSVAVARDGEIWVGTRGEGVFRLTRTGVTHTEQIGAAKAWISFILEDRDGVIWLGLAPGGVARFAQDRFEVLEQKHGLPNNSVKSAFEDREGSLWIGTNGGLARIKDLKFFGYTMRSGLSEEYIRVVLESRSGGLWVGTYGGGINRIRDGVVTSFVGLSDPYVRTIAEAADGALWVGTGSGLNVITPRGSESTVRRISGAEGFEGSKVNAILVRRDGAVIVAADERPLQLGVREKFENFAIDRSEEVSDARVLHEDALGDLWVGTENRGLFRIRNGQVIGQWSTQQRLPSNSVFSLHESGMDMWVGTHGGLALLRKGAISPLAGPATLPSEAMFQILGDAHGFFWLTTNHGVIRVPRKSLEDFAAGRITKVAYRLFGKRDGMPNDQCNGASQPAGTRLRDGRLAIPTVAGLAMVDPARLRGNEIAPPVNITRVRVDGRDVEATKAVQLSWSADRFEFHYEGLSLLQPEFVTFRYRVDGYDRDWIDAATRRVAFYNSLPPGAHTFRVQARNNDGVWSDGEARFGFELATPPWRRWWAIAGYVALLAALLGAFTRLRLRVLRRKNELLEGKVLERTAELQETNARLTQTYRDLEDANFRLAELSATDALTCIANRRRFDQVLETEWRRSMRNQSELSLMIVDVDHFKSYNDHYGHQRGDECLRMVAAALSQSFGRASDLIARYGGEEFAALLPATSARDAARQAEKVRAAVEELALVHAASGSGSIVTVSIGVATGFAGALRDPLELLGCADAALYRAKREGRNRVVNSYAGDTLGDALADVGA